MLCITVEVVCVDSPVGAKVSLDFGDCIAMMGFGDCITILQLYKLD